MTGRGRMAMMALAALLAAPGAWAGPCSAWGRDSAEVPVHLEIGRGEVTYRNDRTRKQITALAGNPLGPQGSNAGLTQTRSEFRISPRLWVKRLADGRHCVGVDAVQVRWALLEVTVDIASEYAPGSCAYDAVKRHEDRHVQISRDALTQAGPVLRDHLRRELAAIVPEPSSAPPAQVGQQITRRLMQGVQPVLDQVQREVRRRNALIDTIGNYQAVAEECTDW